MAKKPVAEVNLAAFAEEWIAANPGTADVGFEAATCDCGEAACTGVQMIHPNDPTHHYH